MSVVFNSIPAGFGNLRPGFFVEFSTVRAGPGQQKQNSLLVGQSLNALTLGLQYITNGAQAASLFGAGSELAGMVFAYRKVDLLGTLYVYAVADNAEGVQATGSISLTGPATAAGVLTLYIGGKIVSTAVTSGMTAAQAATAMAAQINATTTLPVTAAVDETTTSKVDITARHKGTAGNSINIQFNYQGMQGNEAFPAGMTATVAAMASGSTDPDLSALDAALGDVNYDFIAIAWSQATELDAMKAVMNDQTGRWAWLRMVYGHVWSAHTDTAANLITLGTARDDQHMTIVGFEPTMPTTQAVVAATFMAAFAVASKASPNLPCQTLPLPGLLAPPKGTRFQKTDQNTLLGSGIALMSYADDNSCTIQRSVTTYQKNAFGGADQSYLDAEIMFTNMAVVRQLVAALQQKYPRALVAQDGNKFGAGVPVVTPKIARAEFIAQYAEMEELGWVQDVADFQAGLFIEVDPTNGGRLNVLFDPDLVPGLRMIAIQDQFANQAPAGATS